MNKKNTKNENEWNGAWMYLRVKWFRKENLETPNGTWRTMWIHENGFIVWVIDSKKCFWKSNAAAVSWEKLFNSYNSEDDDDAI